MLTVTRTSPRGITQHLGTLKLNEPGLSVPRSATWVVVQRLASGRNEGHLYDDNEAVSIPTVCWSLTPRFCRSALLSTGSVLTMAMVAHYSRNAHVAVVVRYVRNGG